MGSSSGGCEIVESIELGEEVGKDRILKLGGKYSIEDDINKLFEAIRVRSSAGGLGASHEVGRDTLRKSAMKKPIRVRSFPASGIGISESVSLKQALRGLCVSQASEMAAMKRLSKPKPAASSGASEAGTMKRSYGAVVVEAGVSGLSLTEGKGNLVEISLVPEFITTNDSEKAPESLQMSKAEALNPSASIFTSACCATLTKANQGRGLLQNEIVPLPLVDEKSESDLVQDRKLKSTHSSSRVHTCEKDKIVPASAEVLSKTTVSDKEQKGKLHSACSISSASAGSKASKAFNSSNSIKLVFRNKNLVKKRVKQDPSSASRTYSSCAGEVDTDLGPKASRSVFQSRDHTLKNENKENNDASLISRNTNLSIEVSSSAVDTGMSKPGISLNCSNKTKTVLTKADERYRSRERGEFSQSSKSSIGDYSSSTSISEESNLSGSSRSGNRPHMSKDLRWEAIRHVHKQNGTLSLRHFKLLQRLGLGDIGTVYLAELTGTNCLFALKVMDNEFLASRKKRLRAETEREILQILDHPFLPTLFAHFISGRLSCLVMEYCPGGDLHVLRQKQPNRSFSEQAARFYVAEVLLALEYLHMLGVVYRDLKPENILVREDGHIMLSDFDLSLRCSVRPTLLKSFSPVVEEPPTKKTSSPCTESSCIDPFCLHPSWQVSCSFTPRLLSAAAKTRKLKSDLAGQVIPLPQLVAEPTSARSNSFVGTHEYLAPEIIKGEGHGNAVDWWTFGIFLYELLYGKTPFKGSGNEDTLSNVVSQSLRFPQCPIISFHARDLIRGLLTKDPENRLGSVKGATEIKQHSFFEGLNWALVRCAIPPELPKLCNVGPGTPAMGSHANCMKDTTKTIEDVEFELF